MTTRSLTDLERLDWLRLFRSENIGPITFYRLLERFGDINAACARAPELARRGGGKTPLKIESRNTAEKEIAALQKTGGFMIASCEPDYPKLLRHIEDAPPVLSFLGQRSLLNTKRIVAMVGARNASLNARQFSERMARDCGGADLHVASGLARGIDTSVHKGSLETGTFAVVAGGIDVVYPEENRALYEDIRRKGLVIAESPFGVAPTNRHFPKRNRIISGLSEAVLVVEAAEQSGSLITARCALEQGREVMAVPGSPLDPRAKGSNNLLRQGAALIENVQDILNALSRPGHMQMAENENLFSAAPVALDDTDIEKARAQLLECLGPSPCRLDDVIRDLDISTPLILAALLELELAGKVQRLPGQLICAII
jgi:DNA processing protein